MSALPGITEDHHGPLAVAPKLSLYQLESELAELIEFRESCETDEERKAADAQIALYVEKEVRKVDNIRSYLRHCEMMAAGAKEEAQLQSTRAKAWSDRRDRLKASVLGIMQMIGAKKFEGRTGTLSVKGNGGLQGLTITDESLVPDEFKKVTVTIPLALWARIVRFLNLNAHNIIFEPLLNQQTAEVQTVDGSAVRKALSEPCPVCKGVGALWNNSPCEACGGEGTRRVPGARLEPRGVSLVVK